MWPREKKNREEIVTLELLRIGDDDRLKSSVREGNPCILCHARKKQGAYTNKVGGVHNVYVLCDVK